MLQLSFERHFQVGEFQLLFIYIKGTSLITLAKQPRSFRYYRYIYDKSNYNTIAHLSHIGLRDPQAPTPDGDLDTFRKAVSVES